MALKSGKVGSAKNHTIAITCDAKCGFDYGGNQRLEVEKGDNIEWTSPSGPLAIEFAHGDTPCHHDGKPHDPLTRARAPKGKSIRGTVRGGCEGNGRSYKYFVAVEVNGQVCTDDPDIIVW